MRAIRGAINVDFNTEECIRSETVSLLKNLFEKNKLTPKKIHCIIFSTTEDLTSFYPATAARVELGLDCCALFSCVEPNVENAPKKCIRVLILAKGFGAAKNVYMRETENMRNNLSKTSKKYSVAIDGPAGSGKSTIAKLVAETLKILYLDTGAMYRACALKCIKSGIDVTDEAALEKLISNLDLTVKYDNGTQITMLDGLDVSSEIRDRNISMSASKVSAAKCVREKMVELQREIAKKQSCVLDGRDIGTNVLPNAEFKFFLTASSQVRAKRRADEYAAKGENYDLNEILKEIEQRDFQDKTRKIAPLLQADDAIVVDTSGMTVEQVLAFVLSKIREKL